MSQRGSESVGRPRRDVRPLEDRDSDRGRDDRASIPDAHDRSDLTAVEVPEPCRVECRDGRSSSPVAAYLRLNADYLSRAIGVMPDAPVVHSQRSAFRTPTQARRPCEEAAARIVDAEVSQECKPALRITKPQVSRQVDSRELGVSRINEHPVVTKDASHLLRPFHDGCRRREDVRRGTRCKEVSKSSLHTEHASRARVVAHPSQPSGVQHEAGPSSSILCPSRASAEELVREVSDPGVPDGVNTGLVDADGAHAISASGSSSSSPLGRGGSSRPPARRGRRALRRRRRYDLRGDRRPTTVVRR